MVVFIGVIKGTSINHYFHRSPGFSYLFFRSTSNLLKYSANRGAKVAFFVGFPLFYAMAGALLLSVTQAALPDPFVSRTISCTKRFML